MKKIGKILFLSLCLLPLFSMAEVRVEAVVDETEISLGEPIVLTLSVSSGDSFEAGEPRVPTLEGFNLSNSWTGSATSSKLMQGPGGMQFQTVRKQDFNYQLIPTKPGNLNIGAFEVNVDGRMYKTKPIAVHVLQGGKPNAKNQGQNRGKNFGQDRANPGMPSFDEIDEADQIFEQLLNRRGQQPQAQPNLPPANKLNEHNGNEAIFVQAELDKVEVFEGEQITANWYIFTRGNILSLDRLKFPDLKGFWKEIIEEVPALQFQQDVVNGIPYKKALLASHALFPIKSGSAVVDEYKIKAMVQTQGGGFGAFGFGQPYSFTRASERINIKVKPLPLEGRPKDFTGAVGTFDMKSAIEGQSFPVNQPFSLKVRFDGSGNAKTIELPTLQLPPGIEVYDTKNETKFFKNGKSFKEFEVLIIPRQEGEITIPAIHASMFDPKNANYYTRNTEPITVKITPSTQSANPTQGSNFAKSAEKEEKKNTLPEILLTWEQEKPLSEKNKVIFYLIVWCGVILALILKAKKELWGSVKVRDVRGEFEKRMKKVQGLLTKNDWRRTAAETSNLIYFVLGEISGQGGASQQLEILLDLSPPSIRRELGQDLKNSVELFQAVGFAPEEMVTKYKDPAELKTQVEKVFKVLDKAMALASK